MDTMNTEDAVELSNLLAVVGRWRRRYAERVTLYETHIASLFDRIDSLQKAVTDQQAMINRAAIERADREDELAALQEKLRQLEAEATRPGGTHAGKRAT